ncbi:MAG: hypothetical protein DWQ42_00580 [Planctomycetota bacterium]|nr:MAG: hypothetical protein DWQ42_00580 [Planctomycetota bacterium]REK40686.1 MAG: hypothetical protein DWQ46_15720 [Planctomycetota bacterium]
MRVLHVSPRRAGATAVGQGAPPATKRFRIAMEQSRSSLSLVSGLLMGAACLLVVFSTPEVARSEEALNEATSLYYRGRYAEAEERFTSAADSSPIASAAGVARCQVAVGQTDEAVKTLAAARKQHADAEVLVSLLAQIEFGRGDYDAADTLIAATLQLNPENLRARWLRAELHRLRGQLDEAKQGYEWFVDYYNGHYEDIKNPEDLRYIGLAAAQYARWTGNHDQFSFLVNDLYPDALALDEEYWPAHLESARLFLEKFNELEADRSLQEAMKVNAGSADIHAALAQMALQKADLAKATVAVERALEINPHHLHAQLLKADIQLHSFEPSAAVPILEGALKLCPVAEHTLGRLAAARGCVEGLKKPREDSELGRLVKEAIARNPHAGDFFEALGQALDTLRHYPEAAHFYSEAERVMPKQVTVPGKLGWVYMRLGKEEEARPILERAFDVNFGDARVLNGLEVLEVLDGYETIETEHFLIRFDPEHDKLLAEYVARHLEAMYPVICGRLGYFPQEKSLFEIFNKAKNTSGHGWFSARMVGLPHIHTIGACGGQMVAMVSPGAMPQRFNWARVVEHEFVHMVNLQQTNFNIPHWFTEALAVYNEGYPRSAAWNEMLVRRVAAGEVFNLDTINQGFIRPTSSEDWQMAYCQAELYAEYLLDRFGDEALAKMLSGYADNLNTPATIRREFEVTVADFEAGYTKYVQKVVDALPALAASKQRGFSELRDAYEQDPQDADRVAELALAYFKRKAYPKAGKLAKEALAIEPAHQGATYVQLRLQLLIGEAGDLIEKIETVLDRDDPHPRLLRLLAKQKYESRDFAAAVELYELGAKRYPDDDVWLKLQARALNQLNEREKLLPILARLSAADPDDPQIRLRLAKFAYDGEDFVEAARWANQVLHIDVMNVDAHYLLARAAEKSDDFETAVREYRVAIELEPEKLSYRMELAKALEKSGDEQKAVEVLQELLERDPDSQEASEMLEQLSGEAAQP